MADALPQLTALGPSGPYRSLSAEPVQDVRGATVAELSMVSAPYIARAMAGLHRSTPLELADRRAALENAADLFRTGTWAGLDLEAHERMVAGVSGLPLSVVRRASERIVGACRDAPDHVLFAKPAGAVLSLDDVSGVGAALWSRRGEVFAVQSAGNHPAVHAAWIQALALGYRVAIRPSRREPLTAFRVVSALREGGFGDDRVILLPSEHDGADAMLRDADLAMVYGGDAVMEKYATDPVVYPQGPGRSKIVITADTDWRQHLDLVVDSATRGGGTGCTNATAVLIDGDADAFATALAERLAELPARAPEEDEAQLPVQSSVAARALDERMATITAGSTVMSNALVEDLGDGSAAVRGGVFLLGDASDPRLGFEMPFPCVWVAPWSAGGGIDPMKESLIVTALTGDRSLVDALLAERSIRNVYLGRPTHWSGPEIPHDDYLADFLMESRGVAIAPA
jgi:acyl-CoA reductase-like NAD-dependent aldehyde dehydrogenase